MFESLVVTLGLGFVLGLEHALEPDHLIAVSVLAGEEKRPRAVAWLGAVWGLGHTTTLFIIGGLVLITKVSIPVRLALSLEFLVGVMLVLMGLNLLRKVIRGASLHAHDHQHGDDIHNHLHSHHQSHSHQHAHHLRSSFMVGLLHGSAGSAALILLVLSTVESLFKGLLFILIFGFGSVMGMMLLGAIIAMPLSFLLKTQRFRRAINLSVGLLSITMGLLIMSNTLL